MRQALVVIMCSALVFLPSALSAEDSGLVKFIIVDHEIPQPLTSEPGDPAKGKKIVTDASNATCLICHAMPIPEQPDHGNLAPDLTGIGSRYTAGQLRLRIVNPKAFNPDTIMPAYYRNSGFTRVLGEFAEKTVYSAQDVEDVIAYLLTLTSE